MSRRHPEHTGHLHAMAVKWLKDKAYAVEDGGLGEFADSRYCLDLTKLLQRVERAALRKGKPL